MQIVIVGMHRSGTSMVARLINLMGVYFGPEGSSLGMSEENPKGFWERSDIMMLNDKLLDLIGSSWYGIGNLSSPPTFKAKKFDALRTEARQLILGMDGFRPWFLKDPRFCITLPFWSDLLEAPVYVFVHRDPIQVAKSLNKRNAFPIQFGLALWENYNKIALNGLKKSKTIYINHGELISNPIDITRQLFDHLSTQKIVGLRMPSSKEIGSFISKKLSLSKSNAIDEKVLSKSQLQFKKALEKGNQESFDMDENSSKTLGDQKFLVDRSEYLRNLENMVSQHFGRVIEEDEVLKTVIKGLNAIAQDDEIIELRRNFKEVKENVSAEHAEAKKRHTQLVTKLEKKLLEQRLSFIERNGSLIRNVGEMKSSLTNNAFEINFLKEKLHSLSSQSKTLEERNRKLDKKNTNLNKRIEYFKNLGFWKKLKRLL